MHASQVKLKYGSIVSDDRSTHINSAKRFGVHPNYRRSDLSNDIALVQLKYPVRFNQVTRPICLPTKQLDDVVLRSFKYCVISGFGDINKGSCTCLNRRSFIRNYILLFNLYNVICIW